MNSKECRENTIIDQYNDRYKELLKTLNTKVKKLSVVRGLYLGNVLQTRYTLLTKRALSKETVGGIRDVTLGKKGKSIIRFDRGRKTGQPHINIDPGGLIGKNNPHIPISKSVLKGGTFLNKVSPTIKYVGRGLTAAAVAVDMYRLGKSIVNDVEIRKNADEILKDLDEILKALHELKYIKEERALIDEEKDVKNNESNEGSFMSVKNESKDTEEELLNSVEALTVEEVKKSEESSPLDKERTKSKKMEESKSEDGFHPQSIEEIDQLITNFKRLRKEVKLAQEKVPCKTIKTGASIGGGWLAGAGGAYGGGLAGAQAGALTGTIFGPAGTAVGGFVGAVIGAVSGGIAGGVGGSFLAEKAAEKALETTYDTRIKPMQRNAENRRYDYRGHASKRFNVGDVME